jgi:outer membrane protein assembly factor BamB
MQTRHVVVPALLPFLLLSMVGCTESGLGSGSSEPAADEWTYLGQNYSSTYTNHGESIISPSNVGQLGLDWHFIPRGAVNGAATVVNGVVYVMSGARLYALDPASRTVLWESTTVSGTSTPTYDGGRLFIQTGRGEVVSLDAATGTELWRSDVDPHPLSVGFSSPLVFERFVVVGSSSIEETSAIDNATFTGSMVAFDRETGDELCRF